jgi:branched-chain amino acid aminotransferase
MQTFPILAWKLTPLGSDYQVKPIFQEIEFSSLDEVSLQIPGGAYTTLRTYFHQRALRLDDHFSRLSESAKLYGAKVDLQPQKVRRILREIVQKYHGEDSRVRITLDLEKEAGAVFITCEFLHTPAQQLYIKGAKVITEYRHRENPKAKLTNFIKTASEARSKMPSGINEILMLDDDGTILEGLSSNFFAMIRNEIWTAENGVLSGITRSLALDVAEKLPVQVRRIGANISSSGF